MKCAAERSPTQPRRQRRHRRRQRIAHICVLRVHANRTVDDEDDDDVTSSQVQTRTPRARFTALRSLPTASFGYHHHIIIVIVVIIIIIRKPKIRKSSCQRCACRGPTSLRDMQTSAHSYASSSRERSHQYFWLAASIVAIACDWADRKIV